jgi:hypothetical protein
MMGGTASMNSKKPPDQSCRSRSPCKTDGLSPLQVYGDANVGNFSAGKQPEE